MLRERHGRRSSVDVVRRERRREEPGHEFAHLVGLEVLARLDGGAAGVRRREPLQPVGERPEPPAREIGDQLAEAACPLQRGARLDRKSTPLKSSHVRTSYAVFSSYT